MVDKYYTPSIEEFHSGFECEFKSAWQYGKGSEEDRWERGFFWNKRELNRQGSFDFDLRDLKSTLDYNQWRVKYLDKEDIESLGFEESYDEPGEWWHSFKGNGEIQLYLDDIPGSSKTNPSCRIYTERGEVFAGFIKNKSELKVLLKQLNIN